MPQHHLDSLSHALLQKGWKIIATRSLDDFPHDFHAWTIQRGPATLEIQFARFGGAGEDLPLDESYACEVAGRDDVSLYFSRHPRWRDELASFVAALDSEFA